MATCSTNTCGVGGWGGPLPGDPDNTSILSATPAFGGIDVTWTYPETNPHAVAHTLLFRGLYPDFNAAIQHAVVAGGFFYDKIDAPLQYYYWIQLVSVNGTVGELIGPATAVARPTISQTIEQLTGMIDSGLLSAALRADLDKISTLNTNLLNEIAARENGEISLAEAMAAVDAGVAEALTFIHTEINSRTTADSAIAESINLVAVTLGDQLAAVTTSASAGIDAVTGKVNSLYTAQLTADGLVGGFGLSNNGDSVEAGFDVDTFWVGRTNANKRKPFIIQGDEVFMDEAVIRQLTFNKLRADDGSLIFENGKLKADYIEVGDVVGSNILNNAGFAHGTSGWMLDYQGDAGVTMGMNNPGWHPVGGDALYIHQPNNYFNGHTDKYQGIYSTQVPAQAGKRYEYSILTGAHRCRMHMFIGFQGANGADLQYAWCTSENDEATGGGHALQGYKLLSGFVTAPPGTVAVRMWVRKTPTKPGYADSWMFVTRAFIGECGASQTIPSPWSLGGSGTKITGAGIVTNSITADKINSRGLSILDASGNVILSAGTSLQQQIAPYDYGATNGATFGSNIHGQITAGNIGTYMSSAAIGTAYIGNLSVTTAKIAGNAVTTSASAKSAYNVATVSVNLWVPAGEYMDISGIACTSAGAYSNYGLSGSVTVFIDGVAVGSMSSGITIVSGTNSDQYSPNGATTAGAARVYGGAGRTVVITAQGTGINTTIIANGALR